MVSLILSFLVLALVAGVLGFPGISILSVEIAKMLFFIFIGLFLLVLIVALLSGSLRR